MHKALFYAVLVASAVSGFHPASAKEKARHPDAKPTCARASYPGDPVCDLDERGLLPTPSSQDQGGTRSSGFRVNDSLSVSGKNDFNANRYHGTISNDPSPNPHAQDVNGGGTVNYKF